MGPVEADMKKNYLCPGDYCTSEYLALIQWKSSQITRNVNNTVFTIYEWDNVFEKPSEFYYYCGGLDKCDGGTQLLLNLYADDQDNISKTKLQIIVSLLRNNIKTSTYYTNEDITLPDNFFKALQKLFTVFLFPDGAIQTYDQNSFILGTNENNLNPLKLGSYFDGFKPKMVLTTGLDIRLLNSSKVMNTQNTFTYSTGKVEEETIKVINNINGLKVLNTYSNIYNGLVYQDKNIPLFNAQNLMNASDGTQFSYKKESIYYYDEISSRLFKYNFKTTKKHGDVECYM